MNSGQKSRKHSKKVCDMQIESQSFMQQSCATLFLYSSNKIHWEKHIPPDPKIADLQLQELNCVSKNPDRHADVESTIVEPDLSPLL